MELNVQSILMSRHQGVFN